MTSLFLEVADTSKNIENARAEVDCRPVALDTEGTLNQGLILIQMCMVCLASYIKLLREHAVSVLKAFFSGWLFTLLQNLPSVQIP